MQFLGETIVSDLKCSGMQNAKAHLFALYSLTERGRERERVAFAVLLLSCNSINALNSLLVQQQYFN